jgi:hypothetical protein
MTHVIVEEGGLHVTQIDNLLSLHVHHITHSENQRLLTRIEKLVSLVSSSSKEIKDIEEELAREVSGMNVTNADPSYL